MAAEVQIALSLARQVRNQLFADIASGKYPPGAQLPPAREIASQCDVGYCTAVRAIRILSEEGVIQCHVGRRARVRPHGSSKFRIGIVIDNARNDIPSFTYGNASTSWLIHNAVQLALMGRHTPAVVLSPKTDYSVYTAHLDGIILIRDIDAPWRFPLYPELPAISIWSQAPPDSWDNSACPNRNDALFQTAVYFLSCGVRQFWMVGSEKRLLWGDPIRQLLEERGSCDCRQMAVTSTSPGALEGRCEREILSRLQLPVGILTTGDYLAQSLCQLFLKAGLRPKKDFFIVGGSGLPEAAHWRPALSVLGMPFTELAENAVGMLFELLKQPHLRLPLRQIPARLVLRET